MLKVYQQTLKSPVTFKGIGLHTGKNSKLTIYPAKEDQGIVFKRSDLRTNNEIVANYKNVSSAKLCTTLENKFGVKVSTVEHLLAALFISEIDNATIEVDNEEIPIMDGSSKEFLKEINNCGIKTLENKRKYIKIQKKIELVDGDRRISIEPSNSFEVNFRLNYKNKIIGNQKNLVDFFSDDLEKVYESRTFCLYNDIEKIKKNGLAQGGSLENAIVVNEEKILNDEGLRNDKEFVNHKILDLSGDFFLSGARIIGKVNCDQGGHQLSNAFLKELLGSSSNFKYFELEEVKFKKNVSQIQVSKIAVNA